jgi:hypothetical protein
LSDATDGESLPTSVEEYNELLEGWDGGTKFVELPTESFKSILFRPDRLPRVLLDMSGSSSDTMLWSSRICGKEHLESTDGEG